MEKINLYYIEITLIQVIDGIFVKSMANMSHFDSYILEFYNLLKKNNEENEIIKIKENFKAVLNNSHRINLGDLFYKAFGHFPETVEAPMLLLNRFWEIFFPDESWIDPQVKNDSIVFYRDKVEYELGNY